MLEYFHIPVELENKTIKGLLRLLIFIVSFLLFAWLFLLKRINNIDTSYLASLGQIGDTMNIITSLTGVATVALLAYAVYLQKTELSAVKQQISDQTKSTEEEQKKNRTLKMLEEWSDSTIEDNKEIQIIQAKRDDNRGDEIKSLLSQLKSSKRWQFIDRLIIMNQEKEIFDDYMKFDDLMKVIEQQHKTQLSNANILIDELITLNQDTLREIQEEALRHKSVQHTDVYENHLSNSNSRAIKLKDAINARLEFLKDFK